MRRHRRGSACEEQAVYPARHLQPRAGTDDGDHDAAAALGAVLPNVCQRESKRARAYAVHRMHVEGADAVIFISLPG
jgi:hypothetical protein